MVSLTSITETTPTQAEWLLGQLSDETWHAEQATWTPEVSLNGSVWGVMVESLRSSKTLWLGQPLNRTPLVVFNIEGHYAWMMTTKDSRAYGPLVLKEVRKTLCDEVQKLGYLEGDVWYGSDILRMLRTMGATFSVDPKNSKLLHWRLIDNYKLSRGLPVAA